MCSKIIQISPQIQKLEWNYTGIKNLKIKAERNKIMSAYVFQTPSRKVISSNTFRNSPSSTEDSQSDEKFSNSKLALDTHSITLTREIFRLGLRFNIPLDSVHLAIAWAECFESVTILDYSKGMDERARAQKLAVIFVALSCKFNQCSQISISELAYKYDSNVHAQLLELQGKILDDMKFEAPETSPTQIFQHYFGREEEKIKKCCSLFMKYILDSNYNELGWEAISKMVVHSLSPQQWDEEENNVRLQIKALSKNIK